MVVVPVLDTYATRGAAWMWLHMCPMHFIFIFKKACNVPFSFYGVEVLAGMKYKLQIKSATVLPNDFFFKKGEEEEENKNLEPCWRKLKFWLLLKHSFSILHLKLLGL